jgi:hypothetical protein
MGTHGSKCTSKISKIQKFLIKKKVLAFHKTPKATLKK